jgi:uncharacterized membrane protein YqjE
MDPATQLGLRVLVMAVAQFLDFGTFVRMVQAHGLQTEANPLVRSIAEDFGLGGIALVKAALVLLVAAVTVILARRVPLRWSPTLATAVVFTGILGGIAGGWTNAAVILGIG